ncbi:putative bacitracin resistance protein [Terriglobus roseus DSM 18391]|uniref:Undecaprenyl-diphosphatase n=1 Tax=Terriglobus roseus (strain DSM 18391 / NRRL B-41598 / KBS 63) TaxID=926566 RepID=I3ZJW3_TERRK|nr:undecaprenyl-diphosphate phosphatase [Terriglobus roseus]AFL89531.1 putative bacitracin resistance protein [Terriglobus roseus DSM 18391]
MNDYILSVILGIVEGLTEFLPVSSTAHLRLTEALLHVSLTDPFWKMYTIVIQLGAILALLLFFAIRIIAYMRSFPHGERGNKTWLTHPISLTLIAFICTAIPAKLLTKKIGENLENLTVIALALLIGGIIMWVVDVWANHREARITHVEQMGLGEAIWIGICQVLSAVIPGTSRSMSTIAAGQIAGLDRSAALEFSFLISIPTMIAATGYSLLKAIHPSAKDLASQGAEALTPLVMGPERWIVLIIGMAVSFIVAYLVVAWFLGWVRKRGFTIFAIYRIILGAGLLVWMHLHPSVLK